MRKTLFALAAVAMIAGVAFVGCGGDDNNVQITDLGKDGPITTGGDMPIVKVGCGGYITCINDCFAANPDTATSSGCRTMCGKTAKAAAPGLYDAALGCGQTHCLGNVDAMSGKCHLLISGSSGTLTNADNSMIMSGDPGTPPKECGQCLNDSLARLFGDTCKNMASADCNPAECKTATDACLNDK